jgi:hypothetical protein
MLSVEGVDSFADIVYVIGAHPRPASSKSKKQKAKSKKQKAKSQTFKEITVIESKSPFFPEDEMFNKHESAFRFCICFKEGMIRYSEQYTRG